MSKTKDGIRQQIEAIMDQVTQPMKQARVAVDPIKVASEVDLILDP